MEKICCIIGHRKFNVSKFKEKLTELFERLIVKEGVTTFLFGRNQEMIDKSDYCVFYYNTEYIKKRNVPTNSGTEIAYNYAKSAEKIIFNIAE